MNHVDSKFINLISSKLQKFKRVKSDLYNFRCPICGDSKKNKSKTRGYLYSMKADVNFRCHNCGASMTFSSFLKQQDPILHKQYVFERFKEGTTGRATVVEEPKFDFEAPKFKKRINLPKASENPSADGYLTARKLDSTQFYYAEQFKKFVNTLKPTFDDTRYDEERIIIPLYYQKNLIGLQGRSLGPSKVKYITVMINDDAPKIYGLDNIRKDAPVYITEGPFDSTFIRNSIAMCGADADVDRWGVSNPVWIYDNEPRSSEIVGRIGRTIDNGDSVVIWPNGVDDKDINDMVMSGLDVQSVIESNTYSGLEAKLKFNTWKKI
jgi:transcription elongation factor Elf1